MTDHIIIYPVTLFDYSLLETLKKDNVKYWYLEDLAYFKRYKFNKKKLVLHRASMKKHYELLSQKKEYVEFGKINTIYSKLKGSIVYMFDPNDILVVNHVIKMSKKFKFELNISSSPQFILTNEEAEEYSKSKKRYVNSEFYKMMRSKTGYLMKNGKPEGGKYSFDVLNRKKMKDDVKIPNIPKEKQDSFVKEAIDYVEKHFKNNYGNSDDFFYPTDRKEALKWLNNFINYRIKCFGDYQDFIDKDQDFLFHSILSSSVNVGFLTPKEVCERVINAYRNKKTSLASCEGFIRQMISWREYVRMIYLTHYKEKPNFFNQNKKINKKFYYGETNIFILDNEIKKAVQIAYSHHIIRLMVFANIMTMLKIKPEDMFRWFSEIFIDSYDWVMWANVYGMGSYADGGMTMKRPYISSSNYLKNMSNYKNTGNWREQLDTLYYNFIGDHKDKLKKIYATSSQVARYNKFSDLKKKNIKKEGSQLIKNIF